MTLPIYRGATIVATIPKSENIIFRHALMSDHTITAPGIIAGQPMDVQLRDYILYKGIKFQINTPPNLDIDFDFTYNIIFEGPKYNWHDKLFMHEGSNEFTFYGNLRQFIQLFIDNMNEIDPIWVMGEIADTKEKYITFTPPDQGLFCHEAIKIIVDTATGFGMEYELVGADGRTLNVVKKVGRDTGLDFEYGMGKGLHNLKRTYVNDKNVVTKVYGFGGTENLPVDYGKPRLAYVPGFATNNIELYGIKEGRYVNNDIYPRREALATAVNYGEVLSTLTDTTLDFDINLCLLPDKTSPRIAFIEGELSGEEFDITKYDHGTRTITYKSFVNSNNVTLPNATTQAAVGDKYTLVNLNMPSTYVTAKQAQVATETEAYVLENSIPQLEYGGTLDPLHLRDNDISLSPGDRIAFKDTRVGFNSTIRTTEISHPITFPEVLTNDTKVEVTIANFITYTTQQRLRADMLQVKNEVKVVDLKRAENARRNSANLINLRDEIIDPEGNYFTDKIKPRSIETLYFSVGAVATNFDVSGVAFSPNYMGDPNDFTATAGQLIHYDLELGASQFVWEMQPFSVTGLVPENKYFLYAKISKSTLVGSWELSTDVKLTESIPGYYILQAGVLFPVKNGYRNNKITAGMVFIVGNQITAGEMMSIDENMFINLTNGSLKLGDVATGKGMSFNVNGDGELEINAKVTFGAGSTGYDQIDDKPDLTPYAEAAAEALEAAQTAQTAANTANAALSDIANDNLLTPGEKQSVLKEWQIIQGEKPVIDAQALEYSISSTDYGTAYDSLNDYIAPKLVNMNISSAIDGYTFRNTFLTYYDAKVSLLKAISDKAKQLADEAQEAADNAMTTAMEAKNYIDNVLPGVVGDLQNQIDGQLESYFYDYDPTTENLPASGWNTSALKASHGNDTFTNTDTGASWRWVEVASVWQWVIIADTATQQALVLAGQAKDTADGKRRVFVTEPTTPYDVGDLWTDGVDLYRCVAARISGSYSPADWGKATVYDSTQVSIDNGIVTGGTVQLGNTGGINAGITGNGTAGTEVRFWAGATFANRAVAPFRALQDGTVYMTKARISGDIEIGFAAGTDSGNYTSGWKLSKSAILNDAGVTGTTEGNNFALIRGSSKYSNGKFTEFAMGTELIPSSSGGAYSQTGYLKNKRPLLGTIPGFDDTTNIALELHAEGANSNTALKITSGDIELPGGMKGLTGYLQVGATTGTRYPGIKLVSGIPVESGSYLTSEHPPIPVPVR